MTDTTPALQHTAEPKQCIGVFAINPMDDNTLLWDDGLRFYIDPLTGDLEAWAPTDQGTDMAEMYLQQCIAANPTFSSEQILKWCLNEGNAVNIAGASRVFVDPKFARDHNIIEPDSRTNTEAAHHQGL